jgi:hypothetical protein
MKAVILVGLVLFGVGASATVQYSSSDISDPGDVNCAIVFQDESTQSVMVPANGDEKQALNLIKTVDRLGLLHKKVSLAACSNGMVSPLIGQSP